MKDRPPTYFFIGILVAAILYFFLARYNIIAFPFYWLGLGLLLGGLLRNINNVAEADLSVAICGGDNLER